MADASGSYDAIDRRNRWLATALLSLPALVQFFPMLYLVCMSFKVGPEVIRYPPLLFPHRLDPENYRTALQTAPLGRFLLNSLVVASLITGLQLVTGVMAAYALARLEFTGKRIVLALILSTMMIPGEVTIIPNYFLMAKWNWLDTYRALTLPFAASGFGIFLLYQFFRTLPKELEEATQMDGASRVRFLLQFAVPLSAPAIFAFGIYAFVGAWNQYLWPLVVTQSTAMQTAQIGIGMFRSQNESMSWGVVMAATTVLVTPSIVLFVATQKQFIRGITMSGLKG
jgi:ABC-type glycerol-3-phosphate transport system permease component